MLVASLSYYVLHLMITIILIHSYIELCYHSSSYSFTVYLYSSIIHRCRWEDIVTDLTCEAPRCFNIRHTERGVQTRRMKRHGQNLHCIMAFQRQETSRWEPVIQPPALQGQVSAPSRELTAIESLDSSDSDFPKDSESEDGETVLGIRAPCDEVPQLEEVQQMVSSVRTEDTISLSLVSSIILPDTVSHETTPASVPTDQSGANDDVRILSIETDMHMTSANDQLDNTLTPTEDAPSLSMNDDVETIVLPVESLSVGGEYTQRSETIVLPVESLAVGGEYTQRSETIVLPVESLAVGGEYTRRSETIVLPVESLAVGGEYTQRSETIVLPMESLAVDGEYTQRSGTYRKSKPCLLPIATDPSPAADSEHQLESQDEVDSGDYFRRSGTFRKKKPSLATSPNLTPEKLCSLGSRMDSTESERVKGTAETDTGEVALVPSDQGIQGGDQYSKMETLYAAGTEDTTDDGTGTGNVLVAELKETGGEDQELEEGRENLRRSGTFRKERPSLSPHGDTISRDKENLLDPSQLDEETTEEDRERRDNVRRSGTFKKKRPSLDLNADVLPKSDNPINDGGDISPEDFAYLYSSRTPEPTETLPMVTLSLPGAEEIRMAISSEEEKMEYVEELYVIVDGEHGGLRRSRTFTKNEPSL